MTTFQIGPVEVTRVVEWAGEFAPAQIVLPDSPPELRLRNRSWLAPEHWNPATDRLRAVVQTWVLRSAGRTILVDTGIGNDRDRPQIPLFARLDTDFPDRLAAAGVRAAEVDLVVNTHVHYDHVGWNTRRDGDGWVPMFPNARYLIPRADVELFDPANAGRRRPPRDEADRMRQRGSALVFADSVAPVLDRAVLWDGEHRIDGALTLAAAPGHTPGSSVLRVDSGGEHAVFAGDALHNPVQILEPGHSSCFCEDPVAAAVSRTRLLARAADERAVLVPAHFGGSGALRVRRDGSRFAPLAWLP